MENIVKYVGLAALGLTGSSVVIAASIPGDTVAGSSGVMVISGTVTTTTCAASIDNTNHTFVISRNEVQAGSGATGDVLAEPWSTITLTGCNGQTLTPSVVADYRIDNWHGRFRPLTSNDPVRYQVAVTGDNITGGAEGVGKAGSRRFRVDGMASDNPPQIAVNSDNYTMRLITQVQRQNTINGFAPSNGFNPGDALSASYTYSMTYL